MSLEIIIGENRNAIVGRWVDAVLSTYAKDGADFFKRQKDRFANPLGYHLREGLEKVFDRLYRGGGGVDVEIPPELGQFVKLRAVQTFTPSEAVAFVYELKKIIVDTCGAKALLEAADEWLALEKRVDALALRVFDLYMENRERLFQIKINEFKTGNHVMSAAQCPSLMMRKNKEEKIELKVIGES